MLTIMLIAMILPTLIGVYWTVFWLRNWDFLRDFHKERNARKKL